MSGHSNYEPKTGFTKWLDERLPIIRFGADLMDFPTPKNLNYWWTFGGILAVCLVIQIVTGIVLAMHYVANTQMAFASVERIMRDVDFGWLIRNIHANGASMFFLAVYIHMFRGMYYGSYKNPLMALYSTHFDNGEDGYDAWRERLRVEARVGPGRERELDDLSVLSWHEPREVLVQATTELGGGHWVLAPLRLVSTRCRAPQSTSHSASTRPKPPRPPVIR